MKNLIISLLAIVLVSCTTIDPVSTNTPVPTNTPAATNTPDILAQEEAYYSYIFPLFLAYRQYIQVFVIHIGQLAADASLASDADWMFELSSNLELMVYAIHEMADYPNPPESFEDLHVQVILASDATEKMKASYLVGVENMDIEKMEEAVESLEMISIYLDRIAREFEVYFTDIN